jgi:NADP oxidoreductase coenzyme F420-dependent
MTPCPPLARSRPGPAGGRSQHLARAPQRTSLWGPRGSRAARKGRRPGGVVAITSTLGTVGAGHIGSALARVALDADHDVVVSHSRGPATLADLVAELAVVAVPLHALGQVPVEPLAGKVVIDTGNYYPQRDGRIAGTTPPPGGASPRSSTSLASTSWTSAPWPTAVGSSPGPRVAARRTTPSSCAPTSPPPSAPDPRGARARGGYRPGPLVAYPGPRSPQDRWSSHVRVRSKVPEFRATRAGGRFDRRPPASAPRPVRPAPGRSSSPGPVDRPSWS